LLPNATYGDGILVGLLQAVTPLILILAYFGARYWTPTRLQALAIGLALVAFLAVGLIVSTKIGGGGDLHNLDMFLIGLLLVAAVLWRSAETQGDGDLRRVPGWLVCLAALGLALPAYRPLLSLRPLSFSRDVEWISVLTDVERPRDLGSLPDKAVVESSLEQLNRTVADAARHGPVLFMDQRQLLTFGYVQNIVLVPEYEKKRLMDEALSGNRAYFEPFYGDLAAKRFALIVSSPLRTPIQDSEYGFGEENNAWVRWVAKPVLCQYEELDTLDEVKVELLVPSGGSAPCSDPTQSGGE
jgi:hypothetical protein